MEKVQKIRTGSAGVRFKFKLSSQGGPPYNGDN